MGYLRIYSYIDFIFIYYIYNFKLNFILIF